MTKKIGPEEIREIQMAILDEIVRICKENNLRYYLAYGSLIGAVRHKGYIPWDDDMDIFLVREDYDKLLSILKGKEGDKAEWISLIDDTSADYFYPFSKAVDNRTEVKMDRHKGSHGIWVDLFPVDGLPKSDFMAKVFVMFCSFLRVVGLAMDTDFSSKTLSAWTLFYKRFFNILSCIIGKKRICRFVEWTFHRYSVKDSDKVAILFSGHKLDAIFKKEVLLQQDVYKFENREYTGCANYDLYLTQLYGDYMKLPPEEKRITHNFGAWWKE